MISIHLPHKTTTSIDSITQGKNIFRYGCRKILPFFSKMEFSAFYHQIVISVVEPRSESNINTHLLILGILSAEVIGNR